MDRTYTTLLKRHFSLYKQMAFLSGPRQVGKTTISKKLQSFFKESTYFNWDVIKDREKILEGQDFIENILPTNVLRNEKPLIIFDEIHKYKDWKNYLKGFYDIYKDHYHILVTGSAHLDVYKSGGDSLMGRYFSYTVFPLTLSEVLNPIQSIDTENLIQEPTLYDEKILDNLFKFGGFPDPFLQKDQSYLNLWHATRSKQLIFEDIQTLTNIHDIYLIEVLSEIIKAQTGQLLNRSSFGKKIKVTTQTISRWIATLEKFYYCFFVSPWHKNVTRSLIKEPKLYLWDWSLIENEGARFENMIAIHLQKFVHFYTQIGAAKFKLYYLRDIDQKEVDFIITLNNEPYIMIEVKLSDKKISTSMNHFKKQLNPPFNIQLVYNLDKISKSCFIKDHNIYVVPSKTALSQLI